MAHTRVLISHSPEHEANLALRKIVGFHKDEQGDWVADLECGHGRHVRHRPPWEKRPWVITEEGRSVHIGRELQCKKCDEEAKGKPSG